MNNPRAPKKPASRRRRQHVRPICPSSGKRRYRDGDDAGLALRGMTMAARTADLDGARHTIRVRRKYCCDFCGGWHLTSMPVYPPPARVAA